MPLYTYECGACKLIFDARHSIKERLEKCDSCNEMALVRIPSVPYIIKNVKGADGKVGELVKKSIEEARHELEKEKESFRQQEHE